MTTLAEGLRLEAARVAARNLGCGEVGGNNTGPLIEAMGGRAGDDWCALFAGYCYRRAAQLLKLPPPLWCWRGAKDYKVIETAAKRLGRQMAASLGAIKFLDPSLARAGDLVVWHRTAVPWKGHVGIVERVDPDGILHTIEGNVGKFPAKVKRLVHDVSKERLAFFAGLR